MTSGPGTGDLFAYKTIPKCGWAEDSFNLSTSQTANTVNPVPISGRLYVARKLHSRENLPLLVTITATPPLALRAKTSSHERSKPDQTLLTTLRSRQLSDLPWKLPLRYCTVLGSALPTASPVEGRIVQLQYLHSQRLPASLPRAVAATHKER